MEKKNYKQRLIKWRMNQKGMKRKKREKKKVTNIVKIQQDCIISLIEYKLNIGVLRYIYL